MFKVVRIAIVSAAMCELLAASGCRRAADASQTTADTAVNDLEIRATPALLQYVRVGKPQWRQVTMREKVAARIETDAARVARIGSPVNGRITAILVFEGQHVRRGQVLATLHSTALSDAQFAFIKAYSEQNLASRSAERAKQLVASDVIGAAELERREAELLQASAEVAALRAQLKGLGMSDEAVRQLETTRKLNSDYPIVATISGTVLDRKVSLGQIVQPAEMAFQVADLSHVWLVADVPEDQAASIHVSKSVLASVPALPGSGIRGKLSFVSPVVDPATRTVRARMDLENTRGVFKPEMLATMTFESTPERRQTIPDTAIVREEDKDQVFVEVRPGVFALRQVDLGAEAGDARVLEKGVAAGEKLALDGAFHLNNQRKQEMVKGGG